MDLNNTILSKRKTEDNILNNRRNYVDKWAGELTEIYKKKDLPPLPSEFNYLNNINLNDLALTAEDVEISVADVKRALYKTKNKRAAGLNMLNYALLKRCFEADPEYFTMVCQHEINSVESVEEFKRSRFKPIFKNKPGNDRSNQAH